ncbi:uncharacterized protein LOC124802441 [Schistocerca piceifrons]|uniref:uncharacterized protein LOC124802441 n=1 Tax=Schistocerca piceifrons TaxID=274613 RepID=UPI001F5E3ECE|nr:uncharacterized protein LOC124802441 [Schistocerca piceifrons]
MGSERSLLTMLISGIVLLQVYNVWCTVIPFREDTEMTKFAAVSILPEIEEEEFLENSRTLDQDGAHVLPTSRAADRFKFRTSRSPEGSEAVQFPDGVEAEPLEASETPVAVSAVGVASASEPAATATQQAGEAEESLQAAETHRDGAKASSADAVAPAPVAAHGSGGSLRAGGGSSSSSGGGGSGLPFSGLIPQGLPSVPGLSLGGGGNAGGAGAVQQNVPTLFLGSFQLMRMPMPSASDLVSMMQAGASLFQGAPNLFQGAPNLFQGLPSLPGLPGGSSA